MRVRGGCHCGNLSLEAELTRAPADVQPRACDCSFCRKHGAAWLSDADGSLRIAVRDAGALARYRQGSNSAQLLLCARCGVLVAAILEESGNTWGALNAQALDADPGFAVATPVSPQELEADAKRERWRRLWFSRVTLAGG